MSKNKGRYKQEAAQAASSAIVASQASMEIESTQVVHNNLAEVVGFGGGGFPQNQGNPFTEQISNVTTAFINLRWYLVSNFRQFLSEAYVELGLIQTIVDVPVDDGLRGGVEIKSKQLSEEQIAELLVSLDRDDDINTAGQAAKWNRLFGGAGILILTDQDPEEPLDVDAITTDSNLEFRAIDMWELFWDKQNTEGYDPAIQSENFEYYNYYGEQVHKSRVMRLKGITAPSFIRPRLRGWGFSVVEALIRSINQYLKATDLAFEVLDEFKVDVFKIKGLINSLMSPNGTQKIKERVALGNHQKNYQNALVMDSEDDWDHKQLSFAGLGDAMKEIRMQVASDMRMPLTKLFGISAAGFNSGEDDIEVYNSMVESQVRNKLKYNILRMCEIKCQKLFGFIPDDLSLDFKPLRILSAEQEENVKTQKFTRISGAKAAGEITTQEYRDAINKGNLMDITLDTSDEVLDTLGGGFMSDEVGQSTNNPKDSKDVDNPGADRLDTQKALGGQKGGISKEPEKITGDRDLGIAEGKVSTRGKQLAEDTYDADESPKAKEPQRKQNAGFEESKHPRADDGKFGEGGGGSSSPKKAGAAFKAADKHVEAMGDRYDKNPSDANKKALVAAIDKRAQADIDHIKERLAEAEANAPAAKVKALEDKLVEIKQRKADAEKAIKESKGRSAALKEQLAKLKSKNDLGVIFLPQPYSVTERLERILKNSPQFDKASYEADGGDDWIDPRRKELFSNPGNVDEALWGSARAASQAALGEIRWQFVTWWYKKQGGKFH